VGKQKGKVKNDVLFSSLKTDWQSYSKPQSAIAVGQRKGNKVGNRNPATAPPFWHNISKQRLVFVYPI